MKLHSFNEGHSGSVGLEWNCYLDFIFPMLSCDRSGNSGALVWFFYKNINPTPRRL